jgi:hypothetical protein
VLQRLENFRKKTWGISLNPAFERLPNDGSPLKGDLIPIDKPFMDLPLSASLPNILIRAEYIRIYDEIANYYDTIKGDAVLRTTARAAAAVLTGQPGIGQGPLYQVVFALYSFLYRKDVLDPLCPLSPAVIAPSNHVVIRRLLVSIYALWCS